MNRSPSGLRPVVIYLLVLFAFGAGVFMERYGWLPGSHYAPPEVGSTFDPFWETWSLVEKYYVDKEAVKPKRMTEYAIRGMLASLGDLGHWLLGERNPRSAALLVLSHHDRGMLLDKTGIVVPAEQVVRDFDAPSVAILDGCGTGEAGATASANSLKRSAPLRAA